MSAPLSTSSMESAAASPLRGEIAVPGDKSISHRALILASQSPGSCDIGGLLEGEDVLATAEALRALGVCIRCNAPGSWSVQGVGSGGLSESASVLDMGNSGTGARLLMGLLAPYPFTTFFTGDHSLRGRPMQRVIAPLERMGAAFSSRSGGRLPLALTGTDMPQPISYTLPVPSAQVKSAILLAALNTPGKTTVIEPQPTRDHTERMLSHFGFEVEIAGLEGVGRSISLRGQQEPPRESRFLHIPGDPSSAAFLAVAALVVPQSAILIQQVCINPLRTGLFTTLKEMGGDIEFKNKRMLGGEEVADIAIRHSALRGVEVPAERAPSMIDEYPVLAVAAAFAAGDTVMHGLKELKVKESDRLAAIAAGLRQCGVQAREQDHSLTVRGAGCAPEGGGTVATHFDHRIAMAFLVMGMASRRAVRIDDGRAIATSFPGFAETVNRLGGAISGTRSGGHPRRRATDILPAPVPPLVIAIDGPAASGKGTLARRLADTFNFRYLDTGTLYRAVGMKLVNAKKSPDDRKAAIEAARSVTEQDMLNPRLRHEKVGNAASIVSAIPEVRAILLDFQRSVAASGRGAVLDGRDIGTVVCPGADVKLFLTAGLEARARRRHRQLQAQGIEVVYESVLKDLKERDERDQARHAAPLAAAADAVMLDTSTLSANEVFRQALEIINRRISSLEESGAQGKEGG